VFFRTLEEVAAKNEQRDVESGVSELLMHDLWTGHLHILPLPIPYRCFARLSLLRFNALS
jgi:hypothetical protein